MESGMSIVECEWTGWVAHGGGWIGLHFGMAKVMTKLFMKNYGINIMT